MSLKIVGIEFDDVADDAPVDILYLNAGDPRAAVDWDESEGGDGVSYGADGGIVGLTILNARARLAEEGQISITLPKQRVVATDLGDVLTAA